MIVRRCGHNYDIVIHMNNKPGMTKTVALSDGSTATLIYPSAKKYFLWVDGKIVKRSDSTASWYLEDNKRSPRNPVSLQLFANETAAEADSTAVEGDFLSNGFKVRDDGAAINNSGANFIYMAWAEMPLKYANAR